METIIRYETVNRQADIEEQVIASGKGQAIFFVPTPLTPLYIDPQSVTVNSDGLYVLKTGFNIPDGLIPAEKQNDPAQLSTVLRRVLTVNRMLKLGIEITVFCASRDRKKADKSNQLVEPALLESLEKSTTNLKIINIANGEYEKLKDIIPAASYIFSNECVGVNAQQINDKFNPEKKWGIDHQTNSISFNELGKFCKNHGVYFQTTTPLRLSLTRSNELSMEQKRKFHFFNP